MNSREEKFSLLSEMITFVKANRAIKDSEYDFLIQIAAQLGVDKETFDSLFHRKVEKLLPNTEGERILQFHRLVLLMNIDQQQTSSEVVRLHNIGLRFGLPPAAIEQVLKVMHNYPNKVVPPKVLINIFKAHYN
ncbi:hypothetical protein KCTC52924_02452 [Arenibacter antarcticus]|uniref:TerB family tellurite resistance protein n=1 Tax=Arenibacter antarcticus TaxID=2040469 RepID=A0ABW5VKA6_9FLAO|nr:TerB family tellurite resistance protein [Arenibacter sp. H213]MCM4168760.1 hypothetical protein [Arenibacter sp. H213]